MTQTLETSPLVFPAFHCRLHRGTAINKEHQMEAYIVDSATDLNLVFRLHCLALRDVRCSGGGGGGGGQSS